MPIPLQNPGPFGEPPPPRRRSLLGKLGHGFGWVAAAPAGWLGTRAIARGASFMGHLLALLRSAPRRDKRFKTEEAGVLDLRATAFSYGVSVAELETRLARRQRQTAQLAYASLGLACVFLLGWVWHALSTPWTAGRVASAVEFLPFCGLFFLVAFYHALLNFQIRVRRMASWREYLATDEPFWPR